MKIQLDTKNKTITVEENVNLGEFFRMVQKLLHKDCPFGLWKDYILHSNVIINNWMSPIVIERSPIIYPWWQTPYTYTTGDNIIVPTGDPTIVCDSTNAVMNLELAYN